jgi:magnesium transporter
LDWPTNLLEEAATSYRPPHRVVNATLVTQAQNEEMKAQNEEVKKVSAWAPILFAPTLIGTVYGMNFQHMPELSWSYSYPFPVALMIGVGATLYVVFKRREWL